MKKITTKLLFPAILCAFGVLTLGISYAGNNHDDDDDDDDDPNCNESSPCEMTLHADIGTDAGHVEYGDTITLRFEGDDDVVMIENVAAWEGDESEIELEPVVIWIDLPGTIDDRLVVGWEFEVQVGDDEHDGLRLYPDPHSDEWLLVAPDMMHGEVHGGTAHMR